MVVDYDQAGSKWKLSYGESQGGSQDQLDWNLKNFYFSAPWKGSPA